MRPAEQLEAGTPEAERYRSEALEAAKDMTLPEERVLIDRVKKFRLIPTSEATS